MAQREQSHRWFERFARGIILCAVGLAFTGCGASKLRTATEQLLMSDALDRAVAQIDFNALAHQKVYFDTKFVQNTKDPQFIGNMKGLGYVNAEYVISSLRQQMVAAGVLLQDKMEDADYIVEARLGAVGTDNNEVIFGIPATNLWSSASAVVPNTPMIPSIPELALAKKNVLIGAAKVGVFAYHRATRAPVWQSGISKATSTARDTWVMGAGPFQHGTIYEGTQFAGSQLAMPIHAHPPTAEPDEIERLGQVSYYDQHLFNLQNGKASVQPAGYSDPRMIQATPLPPPGATGSGVVPNPASSNPAPSGPATPPATPNGTGAAVPPPAQAKPTAPNGTPPSTPNTSPQPAITPPPLIPTPGPNPSGVPPR